MYDAIVVGARCAGSPTAMLLARKGYKVLLVDKATFPSDTMSTHFIHKAGVARLQRWGLLDKIIATNCPPIAKATFDVGPFALVGDGPAVDGVNLIYAPRRTVLDKILVDAAVEAGAELREGFLVEEILTEDGKVTGIRGHAQGGASVTEQARIVIGADGMRSLVASTVLAPTYHEKPSLSCSYIAYWSGVPVDHIEVYPRDHRTILILPTNDNLAVTFLQWPAREFHAFRADIEGNYFKTADLVPSLAERLRAGKREGRFLGTADLPNFFRKPYGPGWALVGDAGYHKDPALAHGINDAFRDAELLAEAIDAGFAERRPLEAALADYEEKRNEVLPLYELNAQIASTEPPPPEIQQLYFAVHSSQEDTNQLLGVMQGTVPFPQFFAPENIGRILARAGIGGPPPQQMN